MHSIDLNCDMGEGMGNDDVLMQYISSANIACGAHAGDDDTMKRTVESALRRSVAIGAHPSFNDKANFGRSEMPVGDTELYDLVCFQLQKLVSIAKELGATVHHVKPHGALYNMAARDPAISETIAKAVKDIEPGLIIYGLSNSHLLSEAAKLGLRTASEVFADRTYQPDGSLTPRSTPGAMITDEDKSIQQVLQMVKEHTVTTVAGSVIPIVADTICIHGDGLQAVSFAKRIYKCLKECNIDINTI